VPRDAQLDPCAPMICLAYRHFSEQLGALRHQLPQARAGSAEAVHQARIAIRKIRAALRGFGTVLPRARQRHFSTEFRWLAHALGMVRDLDVHRELVARAIGELPAEARSAVAPYEERTDRDYAEARRELVTALEHERLQRLLVEFAGCVDCEPGAAAVRRWGSFSIRDAALMYVDAAARRVRKRARSVDSRTGREHLHDLRIRCKRLRYLLEVFLPFYQGRLDKTARRVKRLQETLGRHQDACVTIERLRKYATALPARQASAGYLLAIGQLIQLETAAAETARGAFIDEWPRVAAQLDKRKLRRRLRGRHPEAAVEP
jgi:CHAD domain-containing protein